MFIVVAFLAIHWGGGGMAEEVTKTCDERLDEAEVCFKRLMPIDNVTAIARTLDQANEKCSTVNDDIECVKGFRSCISGISRDGFNALLAASKSIINAHCADDEKKQTVIRHMSCIDETNIDKFKKCVNMGKMIMNYIGDTMEGNATIITRAACCGRLISKDCLMARLEEQCPGKSGEDTVAWFDDMYRNVTADMNEIVCGKYVSTAVCTEKMPEMMTTLNDLVQPETKIQEVADSVLRIFLKIARKIDDE